MRYFINKEVAEVNRLNKVSLANNPHFLEFSSVAKSLGTLKQLTIAVLSTDLLNTEEESKIVFSEQSSNTKHTFKGTYDIDKINNNTFLIVRKGDFLDNKKKVDSEEMAKAMTAQNICYCFMQNSYLKSNFEIMAGFETDHNGNVINGNSVSIIAKGIGTKYDFKEELSNTFIFKKKSIAGSVSKFDTLDYNTGDYSINLDVYTDTGVFLGEDDSLNEKNTGKYLTTLSKTYHENNIWFDLGSLFSRRVGYLNNFIDAKAWCDAGTMLDYRIIGKRNNGKQSDIFYSSGVFYVVNGYDYTLNENKMDDHILNVVDYDGRTVKPLTNSPVLDRVEGQKHYFNFILEDQIHKVSIPGFTLPQSDIGLLYRFFTQSKDYIGKFIRYEQKQKQFHMVNTIELQLDDRIAEIEASTSKKVGYVEVFLCKDKAEISEALKYAIMPPKSFPIKDFAFLNRLGGWDSFNFGVNESVEFKTTAETFYKTLLPEYKESDSIETVFRKAVSEQLTVKSRAVRKEVVEWLRELSTSSAVFELSTKRYVIVDDFTLKYNSTDDLFQVEMKYHYSDNFNSGLNNSKE